MKQKKNLNSLRINPSNNMYLSNFNNIPDTLNPNRKIMTVERNLNDLNLETDTEMSKRESDLSLVLDGLKKEINEISNNIIETDKKMIGYAQKNIENSKRLKENSFNTLRLPTYDDKKRNIRNEMNFLSSDKYYKYQTPSRINKMNNIPNNNYINYMNEINDIKSMRQNKYNINNDNMSNSDYMNSNKYNSTYNFYNNENNFDNIDINNYYKKNININKSEIKKHNNYLNNNIQNINNINNINIPKGYIKQTINKTITSNKSNNSLNVKVSELKNELDPLKNEISKLIKDINSLKEENQKLQKENNDYKSENKILNEGLTKTKNNYSNELKAKEILIKDLGYEVQKLKDKIYNIKDVENNYSNKKQNTNDM